ncbi:MAG: DUF481 domain-containing protein [Woeseiaceae bacterium]
MRATISAVMVALLMSPFAARSAPKTDVLIFLNGDRLTGEVKSLERGKLRFNTDATGTISIEWDDIASLESSQNIQVETENGERHLGHLVKASNKATLVVETGAGPIILEAARVVLMAPIEDNKRDRIDGDVTAGYNFAKASEVQQLQFGLDIDYRTETRIFGLRADAVTSDSEDNASSQRQSLELNYTRLHPNLWLTGGVVRFDRNDELDLDLRTSVGVGGGRILRQSNSSKLQLTGGVQFSRENVSGIVSDEDTIEAFGALNWDWFRYDTPELDLSTNLQVIPNLTDTGRVRAELDIKLRWEIIEDLFWQLTLYDSYDSDPVVVDAEKNDYGITTSLGWEF